MDCKKDTKNYQYPNPFKTMFAKMKHGALMVKMQLQKVSNDKYFEVIVRECDQYLWSVVAIDTRITLSCDGIIMTNLILYHFFI